MKVRIINKKHPHYNETGILIKKDVPLSLSFLGKMDLIRGEYNEFFAKRTEYEILKETSDI